MLTIRPKDYFDLKYNAAASNRVDSLNWNTYVRGLEAKSPVKVVTTGRLVSTQEQIALPCGPLIDPLAVYGEAGSGSHLSPSKSTYVQNFVDKYQPIYLRQVGRSVWHENLDEEVVSEPSDPGQYLLLGDFETEFTDLNLPDGVVPTVRYGYVLEHLAFQKTFPKTSTIVIDPQAYLGYAASGSYISSDWENPWIGASLKPTEDRDQVLDATSRDDVSNQFGFELYSPEGDEKKYSYFGDTYFGYTTTYYRLRMATRSSGFREEDLSNIVRTTDMPSDLWFKGGRLSLTKKEEKLVDRNTFKVSLRVPIYNAFTCYYEEGDSKTWQFLYEWLKEVRITLEYPQYSWESKAHTYPEQGNYPYRFKDKRVANEDDTVAGGRWEEIYPQMLLDRFGEGKYYITLKVRTKFMLENDVKVDTPVQVYDLKNQIISRNGVACTFKVKRIVRSFDSNEYYYTINCLEE